MAKRGWTRLAAACGFGCLLVSGCGESVGSTQVQLRARVGQAQSVSFQSTTAGASNPPPAVDVTVTDPATAKDIANTTLDLPPNPGVSSPADCPGYPVAVEVTYFLDFTGGTGETVLRATLVPNGCQPAVVDDGGPFDDVQLTTAGRPDYWSHLAGDLGVPEADIYP
jgi:hypothetical protein